MHYKMHSFKNNTYLTKYFCTYKFLLPVYAFTPQCQDQHYQGRFTSKAFFSKSKLCYWVPRYLQNDRLFGLKHSVSFQPHEPEEPYVDFIAFSIENVCIFDWRSGRGRSHLHICKFITLPTRTAYLSTNVYTLEQKFSLLNSESLFGLNIGTAIVIKILT